METKKLSIEIMEKIMKVIEGGKMLAVPSQLCNKIWCKYKRNKVVKIGKHTGEPRKTSKCLNIIDTLQWSYVLMI